MVLPYLLMNITVSVRDGLIFTVSDFNVCKCVSRACNYASASQLYSPYNMCIVLYGAIFTNMD